MLYEIFRADKSIKTKHSLVFARVRRSTDWGNRLMGKEFDLE